MYKAAAEVQGWLLKSSCAQANDCDTPDSTSPKSLKRTFNMVTPPLSASRGTSPNKKRKVDSPVDGGAPSPHLPRSIADAEPDSTPRSNQSAIITKFSLNHATLARAQSPGSTRISGSASIPDTTPSTDRQTKKPQGRSRGPSPVKNIVGLQRLDKPVQFGSLDDNAEDGQLPEDARDLFVSIWETVNFQRGIYPEEIEDDIRRLNRKISRTNHPSTTPARLARAEFQHVRHIEALARQCLALRRSEASWNSIVHSPLLDLALWKHSKSVMFENATSAKILPAFIPALVTGEAIEGKMVDFVMSPRLGIDAGAASHTLQVSGIAAAAQTLATQPSAGSCNFGVNQTDYPPLLRAPTAVTIETKVGGASSEEGRLQLGIWTAAWHIRMTALGLGGGKEGPSLPTLPLILTHDHEWSLYFAADRGPKIEILGPMQIGMTDTIQGIYRLLAVLRRLAEWIETEFRNWVVSAFVEDYTSQH
ncbi:hypothetical protein B0T25DRAFT_496757 [Lasiosphaeria hispida]|uniref:PD-(D/E)XK nuclease-like domain-containing protein n=1 Tax=Lasiosphaeria hispida TaxID=260671 RepID=A0AAJ0MJ11_9PEZI|nr:hypothetical protein B0T25DRAFT_496757 [Lasiosphaeria hispida]